MAAFDVKKTISYWLDGSEYDMGVADAMYSTGKYPYSLFMGHLAIEKLLKAIFVKQRNEHAPFTHSLPFLADKLQTDFPKEIILKMREFMEFYLETRYPDSNKFFYEKCTKTYTEQKLREIKEVYLWLKNQFQIS